MKRFLLIHAPVFNKRPYVEARAFIIEKSPNPYDEKSIVIQDFDVRIQIPASNEYLFEIDKKDSQIKKPSTD